MIHHTDKDFPPSRIKAIRAASGLSMERLAEALGVSYHSVFRWEHGLHRIQSLYIRQKLAMIEQEHATP